MVQPCILSICGYQVFNAHVYLCWECVAYAKVRQSEGASDQLLPNITWNDKVTESFQCITELHEASWYVIYTVCIY